MDRRTEESVNTDGSRGQSHIQRGGDLTIQSFRATLLLFNARDILTQFSFSLIKSWVQQILLFSHLLLSHPCNLHQNSLSRIPTFQLKKSEDAIPLLGQDGFHHLFSLVQFSHSVMSDSLRHHESQHTKPPCPSPTPGAYSNSCPLSQWCHPAISSSVDHTTK